MSAPAGRASDPAAFVRTETRLVCPRLLPEIAIHGASALNPLWHASEEALAGQGVPPPYWAFAWAGGQALARTLLDRPDLVRGRRVLDFAAGSGLCAIAALKAGAARAETSELDPFAQAAIEMNAAANGVDLRLLRGDLVGTRGDWEVVLAGDVFYEQAMAARVGPWLTALARAGATVLVGDPGRHYLPDQGLEKLAQHSVPTTRELEDRELLGTGVWRVTG